MELVATSRIAKAQQRVEASLPYTNELTRALSALASDSTTDHPLLTEPAEPRARRDPGDHQRPRPGRRVQLERAAHRERAGWRCCAPRARSRSSTSIGRKGVAYYRFRRREMAREWTGFSEQPASPTPSEVGDDAGRRLPRRRRRRGRAPGRGRGRAWTRSTSSTPSSARCSPRCRWRSGSRRWWSRRARRRRRRATCRRTSSSRTRPSCSARSCRSTSTPGSTPRCWSRRRRSRRPAGGR